MAILALVFGLGTLFAHKDAQMAAHSISNQFAANSKGRPGEFAPPVSDQAGASSAS